MSAAQTAAIERIRAAALARGRREVKRLEVSELRGGVVSLVIEAGMPDDDGTAARLLCRDYGHFFIGRRGGIRAASAPPGKRASARKYPLIYGWRS